MKYKYLSAVLMFYILGVFTVSAQHMTVTLTLSVICLAIILRTLFGSFYRTMVLGCVCALAFSAGAAYTAVRLDAFLHFSDTFCGRYAVISGYTDEKPQKIKSGYDDSYYKKYVIKLDTIKNSRHFIKTGKRIIAYTPENFNAEVGDAVVMRGILKSPSGAANENGFNYSQYLQTKDISGIMSNADGYVIGKSHSIVYGLRRMRIFLTNRLETCMPQGTAFLANAVIFGDKSEMPETVKTAFSGSGVSHTLALSGMHLSILAALIMFLMSKTKLSIRLRAAVCAAVIVFYMLLAGFTPSLVRAGIMTLFALLAVMLQLKYNAFTAIVFAAAVILLINPLIIYSSSFKLSFLASGGLLLFAAPICRKISRHMPKNRLLRGVVYTAVTSVCASLCTVAVIADDFGSISLYTVFANIIIIPIIELIFGGGITVLVLSAVCRPAVGFIAAVLAKLTLAAVMLTDKISLLPGAFFILKAPGVCGYILFLAAAAAAYALIKRSKSFKICAAIFGAALVLFIGNGIYQSTLFEVDFINVGQGDCALIHAPLGKNYLIDCGTQNAFSAVSYLKSRGVSKIDTLYLSHFDSDHCGGVFGIMSAARVKRVVVPYVAQKDEKSLEIIKKILESGTDVELADGTYKKLQNGMEICGIWPMPCNAAQGSSNSGSLVLKISCRGKTFLFAGDIENDAETEITKSACDMRCDVLKVAHHGSAVSTGIEFLRRAKPLYAVVSVSKDNIFSLPSPETLSRLEESGCTVFNTSESGNINFTVDRFNNMKIRTNTAD